MRRPHALAKNTCPICGSLINSVDERIERRSIHTPIQIDCKCCGIFVLTEIAAEDICAWDLDEITWTGIAYQLRRMTDRREPPLITYELMEKLRDSASIPTPDVLLDELVLWLGSHSQYPGQSTDITFPEYKGVLGAVNAGAFGYMSDTINAYNWFNGHQAKTLDGNSPIIECVLTPVGWTRYKELRSLRVSSDFGFMAMQYNDPALDAIVRDYFVPAVAKTGFKLRRLDEDQPAGLIDDQMRVLIRTARFIICDLTHGNKGAYWEAGFAEGLGKPVIYTCRRDVFDDRTHKHHPHFDTGHLVTVPWSSDNLEDAAANLKATIRATLPSEAILED